MSFADKTHIPLTALRRQISEALFPSFSQGMISLVVLAACLWCGWIGSEWLFVRAVYWGSADDCRAILGQGACWAVVAKKLSFVAVGRYTNAEVWRPELVITLFLTALIASYFRFSWGKRMAVMWYGFIFFSHALLSGEMLGLPPVPPDRWGGFALTVVLATTGLGIALPLGVVLALARRSQMAVIRSLSVTYIELVRGVPLVAVLFLSSVMLPLLMPETFAMSKVSRAYLAIGLFAAAYIAEVIRGGLQTIPPGQFEAARALGLGYVATTLNVVLPQAIRVTVPPIINTMVAIFKDTSLVVVIGLIDFLGVVRLVTVEPEWKLFYLEPLIFAAAVYFFFCWYMSRVGFRIERYLLNGTAR
ncbi:MAG TPA: amino acid ABC transporter permease [Schlesneria sp.]